MDITDEELAEKLDQIISKIHAFPLMLQGFSKQADRYGNYLFLNVYKGNEELVKIHNMLYQALGIELKENLSYVPHMTVGNLSSMDQMEEAFTEIKDMDQCFETVINKISVEMIGEHEESLIIIEKELRN